jgi:hypothetical protein
MPAIAGPEKPLEPAFLTVNGAAIACGWAGRAGEDNPGPERSARGALGEDAL